MTQAGFSQDTIRVDELSAQFRDAISFSPWSAALISLLILLLIAIVANWLVKRIVVRLARRVVDGTPLRMDSKHIGRFSQHLANVVPALIIASGIELVPELPELATLAVKHAVSAFLIYTFARVLSDILGLVNDSYEQSPDAAARPIKGYIQIAKLLIYGGAALLIIASFTGESPLLLLSGLGAMAAVLLLVFRDTILSLVASIQLRSNDMLRVGDWIEMPQLNVDGDVVDIALHTVRVQNFDKTITAIPTNRLISESFKNWRGMKEWGARRIKRAIFINTSTIGFLAADEWEDLRRFALLRPYMEVTEADLAQWNAEHVDSEGGDVNRRRPTNIGTFRAYVAAYLKAYPHVSDRGTLLVRQLDPTERGLPLEIYCFADTTAWRDYESIQSDIFDHLLAILPEFGLFAFQKPSGEDIALTGDARAGIAVSDS